MHSELTRFPRPRCRNAETTKALGISVARAINLAAGDTPAGIAEALNTVRDYLDMDVAFVSEFVGDSRIIRYIDSRQQPSPLTAGDIVPLTSGFCDDVVKGVLPGLIPDTAAFPQCADKVSLRGSPVGSHLGVPLRFPDGHLYGSFCCFNRVADTSLNERDLRLMQIFGAIIARHLDVETQRATEHHTSAGRIRDALDRGEPAVVYQPVFRLRDGLLLGAEALARFPGPPQRSPDLWFGEAAAVGLQVELEVQAIRNAIAGFQDIWPQGRDMRLAVNASPDTILSGAFQDAMRQAPVGRLALEITEHDRVENYLALRRVLGELHQQGCKITVDDAGSGYASLRHILQIEPDVIKLDISLTRDIDTSAGKRALAGGLIEFARQTNCVIIAEGVETAAELATLREMRVNSAQGYLLGRPASAADFGRRLAAGGHADAPILHFPTVLPSQ